MWRTQDGSKQAKKKAAERQKKKKRQRQKKGKKTEAEDEVVDQGREAPSRRG